MRPTPSARLLRGVLVAGLALGLPATVLSTPAAASDGYDRCPDGAVCLFSRPLYQGDMLVVRGPLATLGAWDNRVRSFVTRLPGVADAVCFYPEPGLEPEGSVHFYTSDSFDESAYPELDGAVSSVDVGPEADDFCGAESRYPVLYDHVGTRPAPVPAHGRFGDLNNDGNADVAGRNVIGQLWTAHDYETPGVTRLVGGGWNAMTALTRHGDQDGDGNEDVYARDRSGVLWLYPGDGRGAFKPRRQAGSGWNSLRDLAAAGDLTGDGKGDLLASDRDGVLWTYPGTGRGGFTARKKVGGGWKAINELVGAGDLNSDGRADLVARDTAGRLWLYPGTGRGAFATRKLIGDGGWNGHKELLGLGDVTGDGRPDVVAHRPGIGNEWGNGLRVYPGTGDGRLRAPRDLAHLRSTTFAF
ncbi:FG-GAP-like repeat-containing protein [Streptomyces sp. NPDC056503]|uniref:FG-GAP-like repeat-containing protein n=1 Tax=Streptomyces sp. NPDC056503 TaxID=3345842 RepID=UPI0036A678FC